MLCTQESGRLAAQAHEVLAGGVASSMRLGADPLLFIEKAEGARITDVDGNTYLDYAMGAGPMILGHSPQEVIAAAKEQLERGILYAWDCELSVEVARRLVELIPCADLVRFTNTGSEAVHVALRLARAYTCRRTIIRFEGQYHGWYDNIYVPTGPALGSLDPRQAAPATPASAGQGNGLDDVLVLPWNDLRLLQETVQARPDDIAGVIMVPIMFGPGAGAYPLPGYLEGVRDICTRNGIVMIYDEVITGFRVAQGGAQELFGVQPDLAVYAKAIAAGFPIGLIAGRREVMDLISSGRVLHAGTYNGNPVSLAAAKAALRVLTRDGGAFYRQANALRRRLFEGLLSLAARRGIPLAIHGDGAVMQMWFTERPDFWDYRSSRAGLDAARQAAFERGMLDRRILARGIIFLSAAHTEADIDATLTAAGEVLAGLP
jgi:glutamate-1-semialdehyde 2,1-aminomutase